MKKEILGLFDELQSRENEIKELRQEIKDAIELFCEKNDKFEPKAIKDSFKLYKSISKDKSKTVDLEFQKDQIFEYLIGDESTPIPEENDD
jgi:arginine deiminase